MNLFYGELAPWWPLISPVEDYADEAEVLRELLAARRPGAARLLELGSGGGHLAHHLQGRPLGPGAAPLRCTLTDLSPAMLEVSAALNPACEHLVGDMRSLQLGRTFDLVLAHDGIDYMLTEADLARVFAVAFAHLAPGGLAAFLPDAVAERFEPGTEAGGADAPDGRGARYLEWSEPVAPGATEGVTHYGFLLRSADGTVQVRAEQHRWGLFPEATWLRLLRAAGFDAEVIDEPPNGEHAPRRFFFGHKPDAP